MNADDLITQASVEPKDSLRLTYTLTKRRERDLTLYSLTVKERYGEKEDCVLLSDMTDSYEEAMRIFTLFRDGTVTASTAEDIFVELLYAY